MVAIWISFDALRGRRSSQEWRSAPRCLDSICWATHCVTRSTRDSITERRRKETPDHDVRAIAQVALALFSFGEDAQGELYIGSSNGQVYRINKSRGNPAR